jgi:2-aminomuconate deaminase
LIEHDIEAEILSCFENVRKILEDAGSRWENIVDVTVFLTNMKRDWTKYNRIYGQHFPSGPNQPTRTTCDPPVRFPSG